MALDPPLFYCPTCRRLGAMLDGPEMKMECVHRHDHDGNDLKVPMLVPMLEVRTTHEHEPLMGGHDDD